MKEIEGWETYARAQIGECVSILFGQFFSPQRDAAALERAGKLLSERVGKVEEALAANDFLMGSSPNAADLSVAAMLSVTVFEESAGPPESLEGFFARNLRLPESFGRTHAWLGRLLAFDVANG